MNKEMKFVRVRVDGYGGSMTYHTTSHGIRKGARVRICDGKLKGRIAHVTKVYRKGYERQYTGPTFPVVRDRVRKAVV
jgi:hypothetical protein